MTGDPHKPTVLIFRKRLLYWSETFIAAQGGALERYHPVFVGFNFTDAGRRYLAGLDTAVLEEESRFLQLGKGSLKALGVVAPAWRRAMALHRPALVHAHFGLNGKNASAIARTFRVPLMVTYHGMDITIERDSLL